jgi:hypothetical protein
MNKRSDIRKKLRVKVKVGMDNVFLDGLTTDVSKNGLSFVAKYTPKHKGILIAMENGEKVTPLVGKCCYVKPFRRGSHLKKIGVKLLSESEDFEALIDSL